MIHLTLPGTEEGRQLSFYLAMEEYVARHLPPAEYLFTWVVDNTVIIGRNQNLMTEVNTDYCKQAGIRIFRRKSGGGCVFADRRNIMFSYICDRTDVESTFADYTALMAQMLRSLGVDAVPGGRNDVLIDGKKVSGNAFYSLPGRSIAHGTMLFGVNTAHITNAITPDRSKLSAHAVQSVASRITTLSRYTSMSQDEFRRYAISYLTDRELCLAPEMVRQIELMEQQYHNPSWLYGRHAGREYTHSFRREGMGSMTLDVTLKGDALHELTLSGDFFPLVSEPSAVLQQHLRGVRLEREHLETAVEAAKPELIIRGLDARAMTDALLNIKPINQYH
ncbi:MAG: lipoyltransferase [Muribaculaceae bacterium]|nr:lipoyltransferase [Muribaculaceae bacterium]